MINRQRLLERFLRYVKVDTTAVENAGKYPSSDGQLELGKVLVDELLAMGVSDADQNEFGIVVGSLPANCNAQETIAFNSHVDTSPETTGANVKPQVIENFDGADIVLPGDPSKVITAESCEELPLAKGKTIITSDGTTLLGGDDKAGVAIIMELANTLIENPDIPRGPLKFLFTCDEEIGKGVDHVDIESLDAVACYTFDGGGENIIDNETFSADLASVRITGINIHPAIAKDKMANAIRGTATFLDQLPRELSPERTENREGFLHPYTIEGGVAGVTINILLRDFDASKFCEYREILQKAAETTESKWPAVTVNIEYTKQYRNMAEGLTKEPRAVDYAVAAHKSLGRTPKLECIRGGTDGSRLTELGLPTPNLSSGQHNIHSPLEWACLDEMASACEIGVHIVKKWAEV
ncbi:MAG: peptidase T [Planctomycetota bacterium]